MSRLRFLNLKKTALNCGNQPQQKLPSHPSPSSSTSSLFITAPVADPEMYGLNPTDRPSKPVTVFLLQLVPAEWWETIVVRYIYIITRVPWMKWGILLKPCHYDIVGWSMTLHTKGRFDDGHAYSFLPPKTTVLTSDFVGSDWVSIAKPQNIPSFTSFQAQKPKGCR